MDMPVVGAECHALTHVQGRAEAGTRKWDYEPDFRGALWDTSRKDSRDELIFIRLIDKVGGSTHDAKIAAIDESRSASPLGVGRISPF